MALTNGFHTVELDVDSGKIKSVGYKGPENLTQTFVDNAGTILDGLKTGTTKGLFDVKNSWIHGCTMLAFPPYGTNAVQIMMVSLIMIHKL